MSQRVYVDTSALICVLLGEEKYQEIQKYFHKKELCSSTFLFLEIERNLVRLSREKILTADECTLSFQELQKYKENFILKDFTLDLCMTSEFPPVRTPRSADLIHLRTALWFKNNGGLDRFVTLDQAQKASAADLGLFV